MFALSPIAANPPQPPQLLGVEISDRRLFTALRTLVVHVDAAEQVLHREVDSPAFLGVDVYSPW